MSCDNVVASSPAFQGRLLQLRSVEVEDGIALSSASRAHDVRQPGWQLTKAIAAVQSEDDLLSGGLLALEFGA